ncbi:MAG: tRNA (N(6)-L-threonylcarbamoyladenosine(37)-C(2))-methylthiotransferase MtaB [Planctomycetota bacterium]|nr:MAG: tRNA (N(6)-L-threonylcarbamoyladenosine(37)-C(2))-methylthiotransferase MtaB [Planctomycetota bacterium]
MEKTRTFKIETLGCKVNQYESQAIREQLLSAGWREAGGGEPAEVCIVNSCTVTATGDQKSRKFIRRFLRENPDARVIVAGCYVDRDAETVRAIDRRIETAGNAEKGLLITHIIGKTPKKKKLTSRHTIFSLNVSAHTRRARALLKIQDGCESFCSYCIVPHVRGPIVSREPQEVILEAERLVKNGYAEIVLTGIHLGHYGKDSPDLPSLPQLLIKLKEVEGLGRIRLSSLEANEIDNELLDVVLDPVFCPHFHVPLQSGSDSVLERMNRRYTTSEFREKIETLRERFDLPAITSDIIVGFPDETDEEFEETCEFADETAFARTHLFPFSPRPGTPAASMKTLPPEVVKVRMAELDRITSNTGAAYRNALVGRKERVLFERPGDEPGTIRGRMDRYMEVLVEADESILGQVKTVEIESAGEWFLSGKIIC